ncbi:MAG: hypothetical protein ACKO0Z_19925 [Betaproteobacteria bacterium]
MAIANQTHIGSVDQYEVAGLLAQMDGVTALLARLLYGTPRPLDDLLSV